MISYNIINTNVSHIIFSIIFSDKIKSFEHKLSIYNINNKFIGVMGINLYENDDDFIEIASFIRNNRHLFKILNTKHNNDFFKKIREDNEFNHTFHFCIQLTQQFFELHKVELLPFL